MVLEITRAAETYHQWKEKQMFLFFVFFALVWHVPFVVKDVQMKTSFN